MPYVPPPDATDWSPAATAAKGPVAGTLSRWSAWTGGAMSATLRWPRRSRILVALVITGGYLLASWAALRFDSDTLFPLSVFAFAAIAWLLGTTPALAAASIVVLARIVVVPLSLGAPLWKVDVPRFLAAVVIILVVGLCRALSLQLIEEVAARTHAQERARQLGTRLDQVIDRLPVGLLVFDRHGVITHWSGRIAGVLTTGAGAVVGRHVEEVFGSQPEVARGLDAIRRGVTWHAQLTLTQPALDVELHWLPTTSATGTAAGGNVVVVDLTNARRARSAELQLEARSRFLAAVSHELRTPLNAVMGFAQLLRTENYGPLSAKQLRFVDNINAGGRSLLDLVDNLLDLSKLAAGELQVELTDVAVDEVLDRIVPAAEILASGKGLTLSITSDGPITARVDGRRLEQVLLNLLSNAIKFTDHGGVTLSARRVDQALELVVSDTGVGIPHKDLGRVFDEFVQLDNGPGSAGTGLGLPLSKRLVELMGGTLTLDSRRGRGTTARVTFPLAPDPAAPAQAERTVDSRKRRQAKVKGQLPDTPGRSRQGPRALPTTDGL